MDVRVLHMSVMKENTYFVDILVSLKESNEIGNASQDIRITEPFLAEGVMHTDGNEFLGKFKTPNAKMYLSHPWKSYISQVGQDYEGGADEFRLKLCKYAVEMGFEFEYVANEHKRITTSCIKKDIEGCPWRVHASICSANGHFVIRRLNNQHTCTGRIRERKSGMMTSKIVCSILVEQLRSNPHIKPIQIVDDFKKNYGLDVSYYNAWYGKEMAMTMVHGDDVLSYQKLGWYVEEIRKSNPGSHCVLECDPNTSHFRRLFIAFRGSIEGFNYCRPLLFLDGTFVKNKYKGTLLGATGKNGNQGFFPLAFALVDVEDEANWTWFLMNLSSVLSEDERTITFISDRHKGLLQSVANVFPTSPHGFCIYHIEKNIKTTYPIGFGKKFRKKMVQLFKNCAYSSTPEVFDVNLQILRKKGGGLIDKFLEDLPKENYSDAFFFGARYGEMWSNVAESFNSWIRKERLLPIFQLVESIRVKLMVMNAGRRIAAEK